jgi:hypothetical protein
MTCRVRKGITHKSSSSFESAMIDLSSVTGTGPLVVAFLSPPMDAIAPPTAVRIVPMALGVFSAYGQDGRGGGAGAGGVDSQVFVLQDFGSASPRSDKRRHTLIAIPAIWYDILAVLDEVDV